MREIQGARNYRIVRTIKKSSTSELWEAVYGEGGFERRVAIKRLPPVIEQNDDSLSKSLIDEARIVSRLQHANIVAALDFGASEGSPFLVFDYVDGVDLFDLEKLAPEKKVPIEVALYICLEVTHALAYAHEAVDHGGRPMGIVHRDVNPSNILVSWTGDVRLTDFGIALAAQRASVTAVGTTKGTTDFMAPEQLEGSIVDARADIYALGCVLQHLTGGALPPDVDAIVRKARQPARAQRYSSARSLAAELWKALAKRLEQDGRTVLTEWIAGQRGRAQPGNKKLAELFGLQGFDVDAADPELTHVSANRGTSPVRGFLETTTAPNTPVYRRAAPVRSLSHDDRERTEPGMIEPVDTTTPDLKLSMLHEPVHEPAIVSESQVVSYTLLEGAEEPAAAGDPLIGIVLNGRRLVELIGAGSWGRVYRAHDLRADRPCAIKVITRGPQELGARLMREARVLAELRHPNIVAIEDCGLTERGAPFLAMELVEGPTLAAVVKREGPFSIERAWRVTRQIALALAWAHERGVVHRDLKPANVMVLASGEVKIADFGLMAIAAPSAVRLSSPDQILGSPAYLSPEQISGGAVGPGADLYSLGVILYEMISGAPPFVGDNLLAVIDRHLSHAPAAPPLSGGLEMIAMRLMEKRVAERPAGARVVLEALDLIEGLDGVGIEEPERPSPSAPSVSSPNVRVSIDGEPIASAQIATAPMGSPPIASASLRQRIDAQAARVPLWAFTGLGAAAFAAVAVMLYLWLR